MNGQGWEGLTNDNKYNSQFYHDKLDIDEQFFFKRQNGTWKISWYLLILPPPGTWVTNEFQLLGDHDKDGFLTRNEEDVLNELCRDVLKGPHPVRNSIDTFFDRDGDESVSEHEVKLAVRALFFDGMKQFQNIRIGWIPKILDHDRSDKVDPSEYEAVYRFMLLNNESYQVNNNFDRILDSDKNGIISFKEIEHGRDELVGLTVVMSFSDTVFFSESRTVSNLLDEYGDSNFDGRISPDENDEIVASFKTDRTAVTAMDHIIDKNGNGTIDAHEIMMILQESAPPYLVSTFIDRLIDRNKDGLIDTLEINTIANLYAGDPKAVASISSELIREIDRNGNRVISASEIENSKNRLIFPHPASSLNTLDSKLDSNGDGMVNFMELGVGGGFTDKGEIPTLERRISLIRRRGNIPNQTGELVIKEALGRQNLAVLGVKAENKVIGEEDITGIIMFLENAFVNSNKVNVIDRKNTSLILDEMNFQLSGLVIEESIVEVGNLTGADILAVSEIIRSILSQAAGSQDFLDMCESAVQDLF
jgi:Ca2+-binding EF-hand superfamily protein